MSIVDDHFEQRLGMILSNLHSFSTYDELAEYAADQFESFVIFYLDSCWDEICAAARSDHRFAQALALSMHVLRKGEEAQELLREVGAIIELRVTIAVHDESMDSASTSVLGLGGVRVDWPLANEELAPLLPALKSKLERRLDQFAAGP